ncbi:hypothetical protein G6F50_017079 [Rhizopus delemar]|uniref:Peptidase M24 C-terminal domain-containing protein n=1 Tax=Rhizopus delemar TaxID=936053 RepID=A0A9P6XRL7_9FUNG|nr:hypothetical protein G6F50_017079 [Rhizopus delemar]
MRAEETAWLNDYHQTVFERLAPLVEGEALAWLTRRTFNCETRFDDVAEAAFKDVPVNAITIGYGLPTERCR